MTFETTQVSLESPVGQSAGLVATANELCPVPSAVRLSIRRFGLLLAMIDLAYYDYDYDYDCEDEDNN